MFDTNYYCLVAGLREYSLDGGAKGFDPHAILDEILRELTPSGCSTAITTAKT